jgi:hypothetical protein
MSRSLSLDVLDNLRVASPCSMKWEQLDSTGDAGDRVRHCGQCELHVYNVANLSREETIELVSSHVTSGTRLCAALYRRGDGTLLTRDCPVGLAAIRRRAVGAVSRVAAVALLGVSLSLAAVARAGSGWHPSVKAMRPIRQASTWVQHLANELTGRRVGGGGGMLLGDVCLPAAPANVPKAAQGVYYESLLDG